MAEVAKPRPVPVPPGQVGQVFDGWPAAARCTLLSVRHMIYETARETGAGPLTETLKWGQPAYLTTDTKAGTTIRLGHAAGQERPCRLYVHCATSLVGRYRDLYSHDLVFECNRAICLPEGAELPKAPLYHCIAMALTYHRLPAHG